MTEARDPRGSPAKPESHVATGANPRTILIDWANQQDGWARRLAAEVLETGRAIPESGIAEFYQQFKSEKGLTDSSAEDIPQIAATEVCAEEDESLILTKLHGIKGVNALVEGQEIAFNPRMTVLFGENGAGKTGYARVLKRAAGVRTAEDILPNAHNTGQSTTPSGLIGFRLGITDDEATWQNERGLAPFTRISVFDAPAVLLHVDTELGYVYTPADLALFKHCSDGVKAIAELAAAEVRAKQSTQNPFIARFARGTAIYPLIESLSPATSIDELEAAAGAKNGKSEKRIEKLSSEIAALKGNTLDEKLFAAQARRQSFEALVSLVRSMAALEAAAYETAREVLASTTTEYRRIRTELFAPGELQGSADDEWESFVSAAEEYRDHLGLEDYPHASDKCLYCQQKLDAASQSIIRRYRTFLDDSLGKQMIEAQTRLEATVPQYKDTDLAEPKAFISRLGQVDPKPDWLQEAGWVLAEAERLLSLTSQKAPLGETQLVERAKDLATVLDAALEAEKAAIVDLEKQKSDRSSALDTRQKELAELHARQELHKQLSAIKTHVADAQFVQKLDTVAKRISNTTLRSLTDASKVASEQLVNESFGKLFDEECGLLRAPAVQLEFHGRSGRAERKKVVAQHRPSTILSEGEIKSLALADFLAECRLRGTCAPMIFDDPVTSLDYRRLNEVADRLACLAENHQVIVFTHNIWLTTRLLSQFDDKKEDCSYYTVRDQDDAKGLVSPGTGPRQDTPAQIGKRINELLDTGKKADLTVQEAAAEKGYELIRSWCEAFVEQELLEKVTQRYQPNVMMTRLSSIKADFIPKAVAVINPIFNKACRYMGGHSQPLEQLSVRPCLGELDTDWASLRAVREQYLAAG
jgi:hypothetical protein